MLVGDKVRIKDKFVNDLGRKGEVMTVKGFYSLKGNTMVDVGDGISYRADVLEKVEQTEFDKAKAKHEQLESEREKAPKQMTYLESEFIKSGCDVNDSCNLVPDFLCTKNRWECTKCKFKHKTAKEVIEMLFKYVEEPKIELTQFEYDFLTTIDNQRFKDNAINMKMKEKGYFKGIINTSMMIKDIVERAVIVDGK